MIWPFRRDPLDEYWQEIEWDDSFARLMETTDDERLCDGFVRLVNEERSLAAFDKREPDLCVRLVWWAKDPLDNGGFSCLFNCDDNETDPQLLHTRRAFQIIDLPNAAAAFDLAFCVFDDSMPPSKPEQRLAVWDAADESLRKRADKAWYENNDIVPTVAAFIRRHKKALLQRYEFVRKWPENPFKVLFVSIEAAEKMRREGKMKPAPSNRWGDEISFNLRSVWEKHAWYQEMESARKTFGLEFGPRHPAYPKWEKWYLRNRKRLVEAVKQRYVGS